MEKQGFVHSLPFKLLVALIAGIAAGLALAAADGSALAEAILLHHRGLRSCKTVPLQMLHIILSFLSPHSLCKSKCCI